jgi:hypothetical protein
MACHARSRNASIGSAEESLCLLVYQFRFRSRAMAHSDPRGRRPDRQVNFLRILSHHFGYRTRDSRGELHFVKGVAVALQEFYAFFLEPKRLTILLNSRSHSTELAMAAQRSQSAVVRLTVEKALCRNGM